MELPEWIPHARKRYRISWAELFIVWIEFLPTPWHGIGIHWLIKFPGSSTFRIYVSWVGITGGIFLLILFNRQRRIWLNVWKKRRELCLEGTGEISKFSHVFIFTSWFAFSSFTYIIRRWKDGRGYPAWGKLGWVTPLTRNTSRSFHSGRTASNKVMSVKRPTDGLYGSPLTEQVSPDTGLLRKTISSY